jgi:hypothetical protein
MLSSSCLHTNIGLDQKGLPGKNTLAYFAVATILVRLASIGLKVCLTQRHERNRVPDTSFSSYFPNGPKRLDCYITRGWKGLAGTNTLAYFAHSEEN